MKTANSTLSSEYPNPDTSKTTIGTLLTCGVIAGPIYLSVGLLQAFTRAGFDITRHPLSLLSNGDLGWIQITNFMVCGLLVIAGAIGLRRALHSGKGKFWGPLLVGIYGLGLIGSGIFKADPALGFPLETPADAMTITTTGILHFVTGGIGFLALIAGCFVFARRFASAGQSGWSIYSAITGVVFLAGFVGIASGAGNAWTILGFWIGVLCAWTWISMLSAKLKTKRVAL